MSPRIIVALIVLALDVWALDRTWRPGTPRRGRLRASALVVFVPLVGAWLVLRRHRRPPAPLPVEPPPAAGLQ